MIEVQAPNLFEKESSSNISIFLAGTIDMGNSVDWQKNLLVELEQFPNLIVYNPRRDDWDSSWQQIKDDPKFKEQVLWELDHLSNSDIILIHFEPGSTSQISLLETGLFWHENLYVHCPEGFSRKGNIDISCEYFGIPQIQDLSEIIDIIKTFNE